MAQAAAGGRWVAWSLTWLSYASYYLGRKNLAVARASILRDLGPRALDGVETGYLAAYAVGQYVSGALGDRYGSRRLVAAGMLLSALACVAFGASSAGAVLFFAFACNGLAQSTGWPGNVKAMAEWTTPANRGVVMGFWSTCYQVGGLVAGVAATWLLARGGWRAAFWAPALWMALVGVLVALFLRPGPALHEPAAPGAPALVVAPDDEPGARREARRRVLASPVVWSYGACYFCLKLIRYSLIFWLPFYLHRVLHYGEADAGYLSTAFDAGGVAGSIALGALSDRYRRWPRATWAAASLVGLAGALYLYATFGAAGAAVNVALMALVGALLFGPDALISGAAAQDAGGPRAAAVAAGVVNGIGSLGAVLQEAVTRGVSARYGWDTLFRLFLVLALVGAASLVPAIVWRPKAA